MSKYTSEQAFLRSEDVKYSIGIDYKLTPACSDEVIGMLRDYAVLLRERESAKTAVTDEMVTLAFNIYEDSDAMNPMRAALEAVAPMLANAPLGEIVSAKTRPVAFITPEALAKLKERDVMVVAAIQNWADGEFCIAVHTDIKSVAPKPETEE